MNFDNDVLKIFFGIDHDQINVKNVIKYIQKCCEDFGRYNDENEDRCDCYATMCDVVNDTICKKSPFYPSFHLFYDVTYYRDDCGSRQFIFDPVTKSGTAIIEKNQSGEWKIHIGLSNMGNPEYIIVIDDNSKYGYHVISSQQFLERYISH